MATASLNPRYVFTPDRIPAVLAYSLLTAIASLLGLYVYSLFGSLGWFVDVKAAANAGTLYTSVFVMAFKIALIAAAIFAGAWFIKKNLLDRFEPENVVRRTGPKTFAGMITAVALFGMLWNAWTGFSGVAGATFFVVLASLALTLLDMPFRRLINKLIFLAIVFAAFMLVLQLGKSTDLAASSFAWLPSVVGLLTVTLPMGLVAWFAPYENQQSKFGSLMMIAIALFVFVGGTIWTVAFSFTSIKILPLFTPVEWYEKFNGLANYTRLFSSDRWMSCPALSKIGTDAWQLKCAGSFPNMVTYAVLSITFVMIFGFIIAVLMDQKIRAEGVFRTIFLYPFALSFIVTGHVWAWIFSPEYGLQKAVRGLGWESFSFGWIADQQMVMYAIVIAGLWQGTGFVMALMLAGLRGIDEDIWKASKIDGIPNWRTYLQIVLPMMKPVLVTTFVFVASGAIRIFDLVIAITDGGPGVSSDVPSRYIYQNFTANLGQSLAASTILLLSVAVILIPWIRLEFGKKDYA